ncbi:MAG: dehydrogenase subunit, partial [Verrucomicrobiales bacterium]|nr:dehydrogenase subunit [Verrucomicrobiales bacterium]
MNDTKLAWMILFLPLLSAAAIALFTQKFRRLSIGISIASVVATFLMSVACFFQFHGVNVADSTVEWISIDSLSFEIGVHIDSLSLLMLLVVTGIGSLIHIYSSVYMKEDRAVSRYFASLSLFMFSMLGIVLSTNFLQMFIFWELVGVSSYLLIGFWYEREAAADACKKAFITNRIGDFGFLLGIIIIWSITQTLSFTKLQDLLHTSPWLLGGMATLAGVCIFGGAIGKSAQFPLHVWLPDAMEGPTPVSALIHAATMVAAGVYMLCRVFFIFTPDALHFIAYIGAITALLAALMAVQQNDIKRILAYSTLSQLGYMVMAVGVAAPGAAMFHLVTHAFFKAMLFLGAGSVIHALHHEQDIWKMGGLKEKMPVTFWTFLAGTMALCGVPFFSGFYSKDAILAAAWDNGWLFGIGIIAAVLTTFYMFRLVFVAFYGEARSESSDHAHESPKAMTVPLMILLVPSVIGGYIGISQMLAHFFGSHGGEAGHEGSVFDPLAPFGHAPMAALLGFLAVLVGVAAAYTMYYKADEDPIPFKMRMVARMMRNRFYFDEIYAVFINYTHEGLAKFADFVDRWVIGGAVHLV